MAGGGRKLLKLFPETSHSNTKCNEEGASNRAGEPEPESEFPPPPLHLALRRNGEGASNGAAELEPESELPTELVEKILSQLSLYDNVLASGVCRRWHAVAKSVRKGNKHPWLMYFPRSGDMYELYDPVERKSYCIKLPDLPNCLICYCKDSWLLLFNNRTRLLFFYNPYTQESIDLPRQHLPSELAAFSEAPTSPDCVLFSVKQIRPNVIAVSTCCPGDDAWITVHYHNEEPFVSSVPNQAIYCNGLFYCLSRSGYIGVYDPINAIWGVLSVPRPACMKIYSVDNGERAKYMAEHNGEIFLIYTYPFFEPFVHKLDRENNKWEVIEDLGGLTIFANFLTSHIRKDMIGIVRNSIYFSKVIYYGKRSVVYSLNKSRYYPRKEGYDLLEIEPYKNIWIDAPDDPSILL